MPKQIIIAEQHRIAAVFSEDQIQELIVATGTHQISDIYLGIVENVLPGIDAAFVNIGDSERNGFIHVTDLGPIRLKRSAGSITELLTPQQKVLVQIMKEPTGNKGPRLTGKITLPGRYLVLMPYGKGVNLSRHIRNENERNRLRALAILIKPAGMGMIVRTEAEGVPEEAIIEDLETLQKQWETVQQEATTSRPPALLNRDDDFIQRVLRDVYSAEVNRIVVDSHTGLKRVKQHLASWSSGKAPQGLLVDHHRDRIPILEYFRVNAAIREALKPRVDLPSGGYIIIQPTEALTVIDVNSGSFTRSATARETVLWTNCEAATEIARQLRLRNMAGVIIVDFIDMDARRDQLQVLEHFNRALKADKARPQIAQLSELGLVELTRKRQGQNIYELFGRACPTCGGLGHLVHLPGEAEAEDLIRLDSSGYRPRSRSNATADLFSAQETGDLLDTGFVNDTPWDGQDEDSEDGSETELPGYAIPQERGGSHRRRRRRNDNVKPQGHDRRESSGGRRNRPAEAGLEERSDRPERADTNGSRVVNGSNRGITPRPEAPAIEVDSAAPIEEAAPVALRQGWAQKSERGKSGRREGRPAPAAPELVVVEMTPEEQELYSLMGISPLVLVPQGVKDPRTAMISVVLPGERPLDLPPGLEDGRLQPTEPESEPEDGLAFVEVPLPVEISDLPPAIAQSNEDETTDSLVDPDPAEELTKTSVSEPENRRRRRRSSAVDSSR
ncbi:ribonuclease E/G [Leptolyngbya sp. 'hensonii']|uniref:Rne/Rng family ribonuclease n=1 Tax=Leptolyngbya sp. 'hensonii' TaxID=1922337 RepID=UPI00094FF7A4|nr:Rne/Rng family ribonuclease [Leptolyngbya sp. 'hensonii']OLP18803.1 ribonuclease E/G [Leptolyngbya sp. 'hensonii']